MSYNFDQFKAVNVSNPRGGRTNYDLKFFNKAGQFAVGSVFWESNNLEDRGMTVFNSPDPNDPVFIGVSDEENSVFLTKREGADTKGRRFTNHMLRKILDDKGIDTIEMELESVGEHNGYEMFEVKAVEDSGLYSEDVSEQADDDSEEETEEVIA